MKALKIIPLLVLIIAGTTSSQRDDVACSFIFLYQFGDGISDTGNSVRILPSGPLLPATRDPYGTTFPGQPSGRWSDGLVGLDYYSQIFFRQDVKPYLSSGCSRDGVTFSVQGSTILDKSVLDSMSIDTPTYNTPLSTQMGWFRTYLQTQRGCRRRQPRSSIIIFEFSELNDLGYALAQGKSFETSGEFQDYVASLVGAQIAAARESIDLGAFYILYFNAAPLGCYPYILTALPSNDPTAYDEFGCLRSVNALSEIYNNELRLAFNNLRASFRDVFIVGADFYEATRTATSELGPNGNATVSSCCGIGGEYNYDETRFCGSPNVPVCPNPNGSIYWDGKHFTQEAYRRIIDTLILPVLLDLSCLSP